MATKVHTAKVKAVVKFHDTVQCLKLVRFQKMRITELYDSMLIV